MELFFVLFGIITFLFGVVYGVPTLMDWHWKKNGPKENVLNKNLPSKS